MGLGFAIVANSRPYEGLFFGLLVGGALVLWLLGEDRPPLGLAARHALMPALLMLALTGLALGYYFWRTTGSPWDAPYLLNLRKYNPAPYFPWQPLGPVPVYHHEIFRKYYIGAPVARYYTERSILGIVAVIMSVPTIAASFYLGPALALPVLLALTVMPYGFSWKNTGWNTRFLLLVCGVALVAPMVPIRATWFLP